MRAFLWATVFLVVAAHSSFDLCEVERDSMVPTLYSGDVIIVNKLAYLTGQSIKRGDVVVLESGERELVKRVVGFEGDQLELRDGILVVNGVAQDYEFKEVSKRECMRMQPPGLSFYSEGYKGLSRHLVSRAPKGVKTGLWSVPKGEVFVMGDDRDVSSDSRHGLHVKVEDIIGRVSVILYSNNQCDGQMHFARAGYVI